MLKKKIQIIIIGGGSKIARETFKLKNEYEIIGFSRYSKINEIKEFKDKTIEDMKNFAKSLGGDCLSSQYKGYSQKLDWICKNKHQWPATPWTIIRNNEWCEDCN